MQIAPLQLNMLHFQSTHHTCKWSYSLRAGDIGIKLCKLISNTSTKGGKSLFRQVSASAAPHVSWQM
jgi:hypothetical protein